MMRSAALLLLLLSAACASRRPARPGAADLVTAPSPPLTPGDVRPLSVAETDALHARGVEALRARDVPAALAALEACVAGASGHVGCRWELGWAYSLAGRWDAALAAWEEVQRRAPGHPGLEEALAQARAQLALQTQLEAPPPAAPPAPPPDATLRVRAVGDVMLGTDFPEGLLPPDDGAGVLAQVRGALADADLTFVNVEGPLCDGGTTKKCRKKGNCYAFRTPTRYARYLEEAGVDLASTANNHSGDFGEECRRETEAALDARGIRWSGPPGSVASTEARGLKVALVAFHTSPACNHLNDLPTATALVERAAAGHDVVIVSFHGGAEGARALHVPDGPELFFGEDRGDLRRFTRAVVDAGADLVLGHGPHVVRAMELYRGRLVAYSLGNFATYGPFNLTGPQGLGVILDVQLGADGRFLSGRLLPTRQEGEGIPVADPEGRVLELVRTLSREDFPATGVDVAPDGTLQAPPGQM